MNPLCTSLFAPTQRCSNFFYLFHLKAEKGHQQWKNFIETKISMLFVFPTYPVSHKYSVGFPLHAPPPDALCLLKGDLLTVFTHDLWIISKVMHAACSSVFTTRLTRWPSLCGTALHWWTVTSFSAFSSIWWKLPQKMKQRYILRNIVFIFFFTGIIFEFHTRTFLLKYVCVIMCQSAKIVRYGSKKICQSAAHRNPKNCYQTEEQLK